jgi:hypothetical protein
MAVGFNQSGQSAYDQVYGDPSGGYGQDPYSANLNFDMNNYTTGSQYGQTAQIASGAGQWASMWNQGTNVLGKLSPGLMQGGSGALLGSVGLGLTVASVISGAKNQAQANRDQIDQIDIGIEDIRNTLPDIHKDQKMDVFKQEYQTQTAYNTYADSINSNYDQFVDNVTKANKRKGAVKTGEEEQVENKMTSKVEYQTQQLDEKLSFDAFVKGHETERKYSGIYQQISRKLRDLEFQKGILGQHDEWTENLFG